MSTVIGTARTLSAKFEAFCIGLHNAKALTAGLPPATALWNLKMALAYYSSSLANASADLATQCSASGLQGIGITLDLTTHLPKETLLCTLASASLGRYDT